MYHKKNDKAGDSVYAAAAILFSLRRNNCLEVRDDYRKIKISFQLLYNDSDAELLHHTLILRRRF